MTTFFENVFWVPVSNVVIWFFLYSLFTARGYLQVLLIRIPKNEETSTTNITGGDEKTTQLSQTPTSSQITKTSAETHTAADKKSPNDEVSKKNSSKNHPDPLQQKQESSRSSVTSSESSTSKSSTEKSSKENE